MVLYHQSILVSMERVDTQVREPIPKISIKETKVFGYNMAIAYKARNHN